MLKEGIRTGNIIQTTIGKYERITIPFVSDIPLTGEVLQFVPGIYTDSFPYPSNVAFQIIYPAGPGDYEMDIISCKNYKATLNVVNAYNFKIEFNFFVSKDYKEWITNSAYNNANVFEVNYDYIGKLGFYVKVGSSEISASAQIQINSFCEDHMIFDENGYIAGEDLEIKIKTSGTVSNNYYVGLIKKDSISSTPPIITGLIMSYAQIGATVQSVDSLPKSCIKSGHGFIQVGENSTARVTIDGSCLQNNSTYQVYIVYYQDGEWRSCISNNINQGSYKKAIIPKFTFDIKDSFNNTSTKACLGGLANQIDLDICLSIDIADYNTQLTAAGYSGTYNTYLQSVKAFESNSENASTGTPLILTDNSPVYCVNDYKSDKPLIYVIFQFVFSFAGYKDIINVPVKLIFNAIDVEYEIDVKANGKVAGELCDGDIYALDEDMSSCELFQTFDGVTYIKNEIISGTNIDQEIIPDDEIVCFKSICPGTIMTSGDCDCPECEDATIEIVQDTCSPTGAGFININISGITVKNATIDIQGIDADFTINLANTNTGTGTFTFVSGGVHKFRYIINVEDDHGCTYYYHTPWVISGENAPDCEVTNNYELNKLIALQPDCNCSPPDPDPVNIVSFDYNSDTTTQTVIASVQKQFDSQIKEESIQYSVDGGKTFDPFTGTVNNAENVFLIYDASFDDNSPAVHIEQVIQCIKDVECNNRRTITLQNISNQLIITLTDSFTSTDISDIMFVSLDNGQSYTEYNPSTEYSPVNLKGDEQIIVYTETIFDDSCNDLIATEKLDLNDENPSTCIGYNEYSLSAQYDETTGKFSVIKTGNENNLVVNQLLWTLDGNNPFDNNNSGIPYSKEVKGEGLFIVRWKLKLPYCEEIIIDGMAWGKGCINICEMPPVEVIFPETPIQVCQVDCCEGVVLEITCNEQILHVDGAPSGADIQWSGPNGYSHSGNDAPITDEGLYICTVTDNSVSPPCVSTANYTFVAPQAGIPIDDPIIVE